MNFELISQEFELGIKIGLLKLILEVLDKEMSCDLSDLVDICYRPILIFPNFSLFFLIF